MRSISADILENQQKNRGGEEDIMDNESGSGSEKMEKTPGRENIKQDS